MSQRVSMWVHPDFRKALQKKKIDSDYSDMISFTEDFAKEVDEFKPLKKRRGFPDADRPFF